MFSVCSQSPLWGENSPRSFHGNDVREMRSPFYIHILIRLKALCVRHTLSYIYRSTHCQKGWEKKARCNVFNHIPTNVASLGLH